MQDSGSREQRTSDSPESNLSLWELRCEILELLEDARGAPSVDVPTNVLQRVRVAMREHVRNRLLRRSLKQKIRVRSSSLPSNPLQTGENCVLAGEGLSAGFTFREAQLRRHPLLCILTSPSAYFQRAGSEAGPAEGHPRTAQKDQGA